MKSKNFENYETQNFQNVEEDGSLTLGSSSNHDKDLNGYETLVVDTEEDAFVEWDDFWICGNLLSFFFFNIIESRNCATFQFIW